MTSTTAQGLPQWLDVQLPEPCHLHRVSLLFQGGFCAKVRQEVARSGGVARPHAPTATQELRVLAAVDGDPVEIDAFDVDDTNEEQIRAAGWPLCASAPLTPPLR